jgi:hypothetical protein
VRFGKSGIWKDRDYVRFEKVGFEWQGLSEVKKNWDLVG